jgi:hypothetical protein
LNDVQLREAALDWEGDRPGPMGASVVNSVKFLENTERSGDLRFVGEHYFYSHGF